jgi:hypothetical protein
VWPGTEGGPQVMLGAWRSPRWISLAAQLDGWISLGIHSKWEDVSPAEARDRLQRLADTGIDDALMVCPFEDPSQLETIRGPR